MITYMIIFDYKIKTRKETTRYTSNRFLNLSYDEKNVLVLYNGINLHFIFYNKNEEQKRAKKFNFKQNL